MTHRAILVPLDYLHHVDTRPGLRAGPHEGVATAEGHAY